MITSKNPNWSEADQLAIYKHGRGVDRARVCQEPQQSCQS